MRKSKKLCSTGGNDVNGKTCRSNKSRSGEPQRPLPSPSILITKSKTIITLFISLDLHKLRPLADCHYIFFSVFQYMFDHIWDLIYDSILHYQTVIQGAISSYVLIPVNDALIKANKDKSGQMTPQYIAGAGM